jgi:hypothetical protein
MASYEAETLNCGFRNAYCEIVFGSPFRNPRSAILFLFFLAIRVPQRGQDG